MMRLENYQKKHIHYGLIPWLQFFPDALTIEMSRAPDRNGLIIFFKDNGFVLGGHVGVNQLVARNPDQYLKKITRRGLSSLKAISDISFQRGVKGLAEYCRNMKTDQPVYEEIDFYVFSLDSKKNKREPGH